MKKIYNTLIVVFLLLLTCSCNFSKAKKSLSNPIEKKLSKSIISKWALENNFTLINKKRTIDILSDKGIFLGSIIEHKTKRVINTFPLLAKGKVNPLLDKRLFSNTKYKIEQSTFVTDINARVIKAEIKSIPKQVFNRKSIKGANENAKAMLKDGIKGVDHGGHIIAHSLGGNSGAINIVAQYGKLNQGNYSRVERFVNKNRKLIKNYEINLTYKKNSLRPLNFVQTFDYKGSLRKLKKMARKNPNFKYIKENSSTYKCVIFHSNKV